MTSPVKLAHVVLQTTNVARLRDWWATVLDAEVIWQNDGLCFLSYDDEHHRIAIAAPPGVAGPVDKSIAGLHHVAFTYEGLDQLVGVYERLKAAGIDPTLCINHGPTPRRSTSRIPTATRRSCRSIASPSRMRPRRS